MNFVAKLQNYRLDYIRYSKLWGGPTATLVATANAHVWGVIWRLNLENIANLDELVYILILHYLFFSLIIYIFLSILRQEGVDRKIYYAKYMNVQTSNMGKFTCRVYLQKVNPLPRGDNEEIPMEHRPSWTYREVLIHGAIEHKLPEYYINYLTRTKHNGDQGCFKMVCLLRRYSKDKPCGCRVPGRIPRKPLKLDAKKIKKSIKKRQ